MKRATIYVRISQDRDGERAGVRRQEEDARKLAEVRGWEVAEVIVDNDISAAGGKSRPGFEELLRQLESGRVDVVVAWALDRLTRNRRDSVRLIEAAQKAEALIALVRGSDLDMATPAGRLTADLLAAVARSEIETKSDRQRRAYAQAAAEGRWVGGRRPFGYESDGKTIREDEAQAVRDGYQWLLDGVSLRRIADRWNERGLLTPQTRRGENKGQPSPWLGPNVGHALRKGRYAGLREHGRRNVVGVAEWPAIVDEATWHAAQAYLNNPSRRHPRGDKRLLTSVAACGCGELVWAGGATVPGKHVYRCRSGKHVNRAGGPVDDYVQAVLLERLSRPDAAKIFAAAVPDRQDDLSALMAEADEVRQRLDGLAEAFADGALNASQLRRGTERLNARLQDIESRLVVPDPGANELHKLITADDIEEVWFALPVETQSRIIDRVMTITMTPPGRGKRDIEMEHVKIDWRKS